MGQVCSSTPLLVADEAIYAQSSGQRRIYTTFLVLLSVICRRCRYNEDIYQARPSKRETMEAHTDTFQKPRER